MIAVIDYDMGNVKSVLNALEHLEAEVILTDREEDIRRADKLILPGVGAFGDGINNIKKKGLDRILCEEVLGKKKPILGICLGMQLMCREGYEHGHYEGLGWINAAVRPLSEYITLRTPHIGWNNIKVVRENVLIRKDVTLDFYFVHSYHVVLDHMEDAIATCEYGIPFVCAFNKENIYGTQFHPEKSQEAGLDLLRNFVNFVNKC